MASVLSWGIGSECQNPCPIDHAASIPPPCARATARKNSSTRSGPDTSPRKTVRSSGGPCSTLNVRVEQDLPRRRFDPGAALWIILKRRLVSHEDEVGLSDVSFIIRELCDCKHALHAEM